MFILYLGLAVVSDLIPNNGANAIWIAAIVAFCTIAFFQISDRYWNPMALRSKRSGQDPLISDMCMSTEVAITAIFSRVNPYPLEPVKEVAEPAAALASRLQESDFSLGAPFRRQAH